MSGVWKVSTTRKEYRGEGEGKVEGKVISF